MIEKENLKKKNKEGLANILMLISICLIIFGAIFGFMSLPNALPGFVICGTGAVLSFVSGYLKNGYINFFN